MLLLEIRPLIPRSSKRVQVPVPRNSTLLGAGIQGFASKFLARPNTVVKIALMGESDAYEEFIRVAKAHQDNPFFPRIIAVKKYRIDSLSHSEYVELMGKLDVSEVFMDERILDSMTWMMILVMEELASAEQPQLEDAIVHNLTQLYGEEAMNIIYDSLGRTDDMEVDALLSILNHTFIRKIVVKNTPNPQFRNALRLIHPLLVKNMADIRSANVMIRLTGQGPQLVFIDPVWSHPGKHSDGSYVINVNRG